VTILIALLKCVETTFDWFESDLLNWSPSILFRWRLFVTMRDHEILFCHRCEM